MALSDILWCSAAWWNMMRYCLMWREVMGWDVMGLDIVWWDVIYLMIYMFHSQWYVRHHKSKPALNFPLFNSNSASQPRSPSVSLRSVKHSVMRSHPEILFSAPESLSRWKSNILFLMETRTGDRWDSSVIPRIFLNVCLLALRLLWFLYVTKGTNLICLLDFQFSYNWHSSYFT